MGPHVDAASHPGIRVIPRATRPATTPAVRSWRVHLGLVSSNAMTVTWSVQVAWIFVASGVSLEHALLCVKPSAVFKNVKDRNVIMSTWPQDVEPLFQVFIFWCWRVSSRRPPFCLFGRWCCHLEKWKIGIGGKPISELKATVVVLTVCVL